MDKETEKHMYTHRHTEKYLSAIKKRNPSICYHMVLENRQRQILHDLTYLWNLKKKKTHKLLETE